MHKTFTTLLLIAGLLISSNLYAANPKDKLKATIEDLKTSRTDKQKLDKKLTAIGTELRTIQTQSVTLAKAIREKESDIQTQETRLGALRKNLQKKEVDFVTRKHDVGSLIHAMVRMQRMPRQFIMAQPSEIEPLLRTASALNISYGAVETEMTALAQDIEALTVLRAEVIEKRDNITESRKMLLSKQDEMNVTLNKRQSLQHQLNRDHDKLAERIASLTKTSSSLRELMAKIEKESALFKHVGIPKSKPDAPKPLSFAKRKGMLPYPAVGTLIHRYGQKKGENDTYQGQVLKTSARAQVTTPHSGTVVFSGTFMDYGKMIIIQHDDSYHSLVAGLANVRAELGQHLTSGEPIGTMGATLKSRELYFELRKRSKAIDPSAWMSNVIVAKR